MNSAALICWIARAWGVASSLLLLAFAFGGREHLRLTTVEAVGFLFFPVGVIVGFTLAWWRELTGGLVTVASLTFFYLWLFARDGRLSAGPYFILFAAPGFLHIASSLLAGRGQSTSIGVPSGALGSQDVEPGAAANNAS
jgi:hypothetical protein